MNRLIKALSVWLCIIFCPQLLFAQTAAILPQPLTQFLDNNANPLAAGTVDTYIAGTSTRKTTWQDAGETIPNTNPVILNAGGRAIIYGDGNYRLVVKDRLGNLIYDGLSSAIGSGGATLFGDGTAVGTVLPWSGFIAPAHYAFAYGQEVSRVTYSALYGSITLNTPLNCTNGSNILSGISDTSQIPIGAPVEAVCVAAGTTVTAKAASTVTVSNNASVTLGTQARFFPWGNGNGTTTFNIPDLRGRVLPGRDNMGGTASARLTSTYYGANPDAMGASGGTQSVMLGTNNLPAYTPSGTIVSTQGAHNHFIANGDSGTVALQSNTFMALTASTYTLTGTATTAVIGPTTNATPTITSTLTGTAQGGTSTPFSTVQPSITLNYIIKITPDTTISTLNVVTSIGGMTGDIICGAGTTCSGQTISVAGAGTGDVIGPASATDYNIAVFDGITGKIIKEGLTGSGANVINNPFAGDWLSHYNASFVDNAPHIGNAKIAFSASTYAVGSGMDGPANGNYAGFIVAQKQNYLTSAISGEIDAIYINAYQGKFGDAAAILGGTVKVNGGTGAGLGLELGVALVNSSGVTQQLSHTIMGLMSVDSSEYVGYNAEAWVGTLTAAFRADTFNFIGTPAWTNVLTARTGRSDANIYFNIDGSGRVAANVGSAASPAYGFVGGAGEGMWRPGAGTLGWSINSAAEMQLTSTALSPAVDGGSSLGTTALSWQNLFGNTGFVFNIEGGDWVATHTTGILTVGTGDLRVTNAGTNSASVVTVGGTQTLTGKTIDAAQLSGTVASARLTGAYTGITGLGTIAGLTVTGSFTATGLVTNGDLVNASTTVNGQTCTLGSTCSITTTSIVVGTTSITSGTSTRILYDNAGVLGEYTITGTGTVVAMQTSPTFVTPALGTPSSGVVTNLTGTASININGTVGATTPAAGTFTSGNFSSAALGVGSATTMAVGGCTIGANAFCAGTGTSAFTGAVTFGVGTGSYGITVNGGNTGASDAAFLSLTNAGVSNLYLGNLNGIVAGVYTTDQLMFIPTGAFHLYTGGVEHLTVSTTGLTTIAGPIKTAGYTVSTLPAGSIGMRAYVTDQLTTCVATGVALVGGGAVVCPAFYNGSAWVGG